MTDLAGALADTSGLTPFEGLAVRQVGIEIPGAAGGLRDAMKIEPAEFHKGETVYVVLQCVVGRVRFDPIDKDDPAGDQRRVHIFDVEGATMVDGDLVREHLDAQADRIARAKDRAAGVSRLPTPDEVERLQVEHEAGVHRDLVAGCPDCDTEAKAAADEAGDPAPIGADDNWED